MNDFSFAFLVLGQTWLICDLRCGPLLLGTVFHDALLTARTGNRLAYTRLTAHRTSGFTPPRPLGKGSAPQNKTPRDYVNGPGRSPRHGGDMNSPRRFVSPWGEDLEKSVATAAILCRGLALSCIKIPTAQTRCRGYALY